MPASRPSSTTSTAPTWPSSISAAATLTVVSGAATTSRRGSIRLPIGRLSISVRILENHQSRRRVGNGDVVVAVDLLDAAAERGARDQPVEHLDALRPGGL